MQCMSRHFIVYYSTTAVLRALLKIAESLMAHKCCHLLVISFNNMLTICTVNNMYESCLTTQLFCSGIFLLSTFIFENNF